jgi:hypothetical protein
LANEKGILNKKLKIKSFMLKQKNIILSLIIASTAGMVIGISSCKTSSVAKNPCAGIATSYTTDIKPILDANCASSCHSAEKHMHHLDLSTYESVKAESGNPEFLGAINHESNYTPMPKNHPKLDDASIQKIQCWVQNGAAQ